MEPSDQAGIVRWITHLKNPATCPNIDFIANKELIALLIYKSPDFKSSYPRYSVDDG
jgi:hypothetical protein